MTAADEGGHEQSVGSRGGLVNRDGVADVLFDDHKPSGKLSHSWPKTGAQASSNFGDQGYDPQFMLGHGLTF